MSRQAQATPCNGAAYTASGKRIIRVALLALCSVAAGPVALADDLGPDQVHQLGQAYGSLAGYSATLAAVGSVCGGDTKDLVAVWKGRNEKRRAEAEALVQRLISQVARQNGEKAASDFKSQFRQEMDRQGKAAASQTAVKLATLPPDQRASVCKKWDASVRAGEWDVARKAPAIDKFLAGMSQ